MHVVECFRFIIIGGLCYPWCFLYVTLVPDDAMDMKAFFIEGFKSIYLNLHFITIRMPFFMLLLLKIKLILEESIVQMNTNPNDRVFYSINFQIKKHCFWSWIHLYLLPNYKTSVFNLLFISSSLLLIPIS